MAFYIDDMIEFAQNVQAYRNGMNQAELVADRRIFEATLRSLELIDEAASNMPKAIREQYETVPWRTVITTHISASITTDPGASFGTICPICFSRWKG